jgi:hypothetical protein
MRQPQISYQGYLEPVTRLINCHFGQLIHTCHVCMFCYVMDMNNLLVHTPNVSNNSWELLGT